MGSRGVGKWGSQIRGKQGGYVGHKGEGCGGDFGGRG